jgi:cholesterol transport system auxiliary component
MTTFGTASRTRISAMPRHTFALSRPMLLAFAAFAAFTIAGCSTPGRSPASTPARYDFGVPPESTAPVHLSSPVRVVSAAAPSALSTDAFQYRLRYADDRQAHAYAGSRWTEPPAQLFTARLRDEIARQGRVLDSNDGGPAVPVLKLELEEFAQVFDQPGASQGLVRVRVTLLHGSALIAQQSFTVSSPAASADAAGGAKALAQASDTAIGQILAWLASQNL